MPGGALIAQCTAAKAVAHLPQHHGKPDPGRKAMCDRNGQKARHRRQAQYPQQPLEHKGQCHCRTRHRQHLARIQPQPRRRTMHRGQHRRKQQCHHRGGRIHDPCTGCRQRQQQTGQGCRPQCQRCQRMVCRQRRKRQQPQTHCMGHGDSGSRPRGRHARGRHGHGTGTPAHRGGGLGVDLGVRHGAPSARRGFRARAPRRCRRP